MRWFMCGVALVVLLPATARAATPATGALTDPAAQVRWKGVANGVAPPDERACLAATCDEFALDVKLPALAKGSGLQIGVRWGDEAVDLDLYVYGPDGSLAAKSNGFQASTSESVQLTDAANGTYRVVVSPAFTDLEDLNFEGLAEIEAPIARDPVRDLLPDLVPLGPRNLTFKTAQYLTDLGLPTNDLSSCYPEERIEQSAQRCLRFDQVIANLGKGPFELRYRLDQSATDQSLLQRIYRTDGTIHERKADTWEFHPAHAHFHYKNFAQSKLWRSDAAGNRLGDQPVRIGKKNGFCMIDVEDHWFGLKGDAPRTYYFPRCNLPSNGEQSGDVSMINGISPGWADVYNWYLADQFIEVTGVPDGYYVLETIADAVNTIVEADENDNVVTSLIKLTGDHAEFVDKPAAAAAAAATVQRRPRLRIAVSPARLRAGRRSVLRVTVTALSAGRYVAVRGARVSAAGHAARTDAHGRARLAVRPRRAGTLVLQATHRGLRAGTLKLRVR